MAHYELSGESYPRTTEILNAYPDGGKSGALKGWAAAQAIKDLAQKLSTWTEEDAGRHMHELDRYFAEVSKPAREQDQALVDAWRPVVKAHQEAHREVLRFLGDAGTKAHTLIEEALKLSMGLTSATVDGLEADYNGELDLLTQYALNAAANWGRWFEQRAKPAGFKPLALELKLISPTLGYGGTVDCVCEWKGGVHIGDWKTSSRIDRIRHGMQTVAYLALIEEEAVCVFKGTPQEKIVSRAEAREKWPHEEHEPVRIDGCFIARLDRLETAFEHYEVPPGRIGPHWEMFKKCLEIVEAKSAYERAIRSVK
jgi:hypothetical protein